MSNSVWQKMYDFIKGLKTPRWLVAILQELQNILVEVLCQIGKEYLNQIQAKIVEVSSTNYSNEKKFMIVFNFAKGLLPDVKEHLLNLLIESLYAKFKRSGYVS